MDTIKISPEYLSDQELVRKTIDQVNKDFYGIDLGLETVEPSENYFSDLVRELSYTVDSLLDSNPERLFALLYRIDLPEGMANRILTLTEPHLKLSELILKRELQKVVLRKMYS